MNLNEMRAFVALAETGSVNRAARRLNLTQPATTRRIQGFEASLGQSLLDRSSKPSMLTAAGRRALEHCRTVLAAVTALEDDAVQDGPGGELRLGVANGVADIVLAGPLDALRGRYPRLRLAVSSDWTGAMIGQIAEGRLDAAIGLRTPWHQVPDGIAADALGAEQVVVVAARGLDLPPQPGLAALPDLGWVLNPRGCGYRAVLERAHEAIGRDLRLSAEVFARDLQLSLVARGAGLGLLPRRILARSPLRSRLRIVPLADFALDVPVVLLRGRTPDRLAAPLAAFARDVGAALAGDDDAESVSRG